MKKLIRKLLGIEPNLDNCPSIGKPNIITISNTTGDLWAADVYKNPTNTE